MEGIPLRKYNRDVEVDDGRRPRTQAQPSSPKVSTAPTAPSEETIAFSNTGKQNLNGYVNHTGYVHGNKSGAINFGSSADLQKKADVLKDLLGAVNSKDDGKTQNGSPATPPNNHPTSIPGRSPPSRIFKNTGEQTFKGLINLSGFTDGDGSGAINFD